MSDPSENAPAPENQISMQIPEEMKCPACGARIDVRGLAAFSKIECPGCRAEARVPAKFSHFTLLRRLGSGGMGTVRRHISIMTQIVPYVVTIVFVLS